MGSMATWKKGGAVGEDDCEMCYKHKTNPENKWEKKKKKTGRETMKKISLSLFSSLLVAFYKMYF